MHDVIRLLPYGPFTEKAAAHVLDTSGDETQHVATYLDPLAREVWWFGAKGPKIPRSAWSNAMEEAFLTTIRNSAAANYPGLLLVLDPTTDRHHEERIPTYT